MDPTMSLQVPPRGRRTRSSSRLRDLPDDIKTAEREIKVTGEREYLAFKAYCLQQDQRDLSLEDQQAILYRGADSPVTPSLYAKPRAAVYLGNLTPTQVLLHNRFAVSCSYPVHGGARTDTGSAFELNPFRPILVGPEIRLRAEERIEQVVFDVQSVQTRSTSKSYRAMEIERHILWWTRYSTHLAMVNILNYLESRPHLAYDDEKDAETDRLFQHVFEFVVDHSLEAEKHDWTYGIEVEGRICGWDGIIKRVLRHNQSNHDLFVRFERRLYLSRNNAFDLSALELSRTKPKTTVSSLLRRHDRPKAAREAFSHYKEQVKAAASALKEHSSTTGMTNRALDIIKNPSSDPLVMTIAKAQDNVDKAVAESISIQQADRLCADVEKWDSFCTSFAALASRVVEEPISPVCDVFAGLRIPGILGADTLEEQRRNAAFNIIGSYEQWAKATVPMSETEEVYQRQLAMAKEYPRSPFARDGVPDEKDVLELIRERYEAKSSPVTFDPLTVAKQVKEQLSTITTSRKGRNQDEGNPRVESKMVSKTDDQSARHPTPGMESISTHLQRGRSGNNSDGSGSGSPGSDSDRSLAALFTEEEEEELVKVLTRLNPVWSSLKEGDNFHLQDLIIPVLLVEHKRLAVKNWSEQGLNQLLIYMVSAVQLLATIGIYNMPVYGLVTDGPVGVVLTAWGVRTECTPLPFKIMIADKNAPTFDITNPIQALRFASFLIRLRLEHVPKLYRAFEDIKDKFMNDWRDPNKAANFQWRSADQKRMDAISEFEKVRDECLQKARDVLKKAHEAKGNSTPA